MNKPIFVWIKSLKFSANLPTANCELISSNSLVNAITSAEIARNCQASHGFAQMILSHDYQGNTVICAIKAISTKCTEQQYIQMVNSVHDHRDILVGRFLRLLSYVTLNELQPFVDFILNKDEILKLFMNSEASYKHHHSYKGGLFEHSIEVAEMTYQNARHLGHSNVECQTGLIAALFHDIGKIYPALNTNNVKYCPGPHESYAFALLAKPLGELGTSNSRIFSMLSDLLAVKPYGHKTRYAIEHILKLADRTSAESNFAKSQFKALPADYYFTKVNGDLIYRLNNQ
ncbi:HD domain-containing protein [Shewanella sp. SNU WT4]|uniref:HD domain-containing protein n=1 Tax=Shewanella sp. SNU WT4 TaxID=2590015 RepID=UPI00143DF028|nr:HD domain-containing protein [Shewanella sp. SNU WT4]